MIRERVSQRLRARYRHMEILDAHEERRVRSELYPAPVYAMGTPKNGLRAADTAGARTHNPQEVTDANGF